jgi:hypothetical protein
MALQIRRGPNAQRATTLLQTGEISWTTDTKKLYVGDGVTTGGVNILANIAGTGFVWNPSTEQLDLAGSTITGINADNVSETNGVVPRLWYRSSLGKTHASEIFTTSAGTAHVGISFSWDDVNQKLTATVTSENAQDAAAALFTAGTHTGISFNYGLTQDAANRIDATVDTEWVQDRIAELFAAGVHTGITFTYSDNVNALSAAVNMGGSLASNLVMNSRNITGTGNINIVGTIAASTGLGQNLSLNSFDITGTGDITIEGIIEARQIISGTGGAYITQTVHRGTFASPTAVQAGDELGGILLKGYTNTTKQAIAGVISCIVDPTAVIAGGDFVKTIMAFSAATDTTQNEADSMTLDSAGVVTSNAVVANKYFQMPVYANDAARTTAIPTPAKGMMVFMTAGTVPTVSNKAVVYNGTAWALMPG